MKKNESNMTDIEKLRPVLEAIVGKGRYEKILSPENQDVLRMMSAPKTYFAKMLEGVNAGLVDIDEDQQLETIMQYALLLMEVGDEMEKREVEQEESALSKHPGALALRDFLVKAVGKLGRDTVTRELGSLLELEPSRILKANPGLAYIMQSHQNGEEVDFESQAATIADMIKGLAESWYKYILSAILRIYRLYVGKPGDDKQNVGDLIINCKNIWGKNCVELLGIVDDRIRIIRNSVAHEKTDVDVDFITFKNVNTKGVLEVLGPLNREELGVLYSGFLNLCMTSYYAMKSSVRVGNVPNRAARFEHAFVYFASTFLQFLESSEYKEAQEGLIEKSNYLISLSKDTDPVTKMKACLHVMQKMVAWTESYRKIMEAAKQAKLIIESAFSTGK